MGIPDIDMTLVVGQMAASVFTDTETFTESSCPLAEECIVGAGDRRLLHFSTITPNVGEGDFIVGSPDLEPEKFEWGECHGHWHFKDFANYQLLDAEMNVVATGHKMSFALIDLAPWSDDAGRGKYPLFDGTQGITVGWADIYMWGLDCQWVDITGVPPGDYTLEVSINPEQLIEEITYDNNIASIPVTITDVDTGMPGNGRAWRASTPPSTVATAGAVRSIRTARIRRPTRATTATTRARARRRPAARRSTTTTTRRATELRAAVGGRVPH
jgi:hypothetical protein